MRATAERPWPHPVPGPREVKVVNFPLGLPSSVVPDHIPKRTSAIPCNGALVLARTCPRSIKRRDSAIGTSQETVIDIARITVKSRDRARRVDAETFGA
jgi:hypothetical protein